MKKIAALILLIGFAGQTFSQGIIILNFYIHQSYIAATQCENRYRPMLHCDGKCVLAKRLKQEEHRDQQNPELKLSSKNEVLSSKSFFLHPFAAESMHNKDYCVFSDNRTFDSSPSIFHPPA
ncbi:MAG TPA: hypothetical protein VHD35_02370 [Chitinophagaceae bacterium]|nr:hypothetical protein [Chitinophagaceae bacterium]